MAVKIKKFRYVRFALVLGAGIWRDQFNLLEHGFDGENVTIVLPFCIIQYRFIAEYDQKELKFQKAKQKRGKLIKMDSKN